MITGKDGITYVIDRDSMGRYRSAVDAVQTLRTSKGGFGAAAYWNHLVYVWGSFDVIKAYSVTGGKLVLQHVGATRVTDPGATPVISSNGGRDGIVWAVETRTWNGADKVAVLHAYDASDVRHELFNSQMNATRDGAGVATRFAIPTIAAGHVYVGTKAEVDVYGIIR